MGLFGFFSKEPAKSQRCAFCGREMNCKFFHDIFDDTVPYIDIDGTDSLLKGKIQNGQVCCNCAAEIRNLIRVPVPHSDTFVSYIALHKDESNARWFQAKERAVKLAQQYLPTMTDPIFKSQVEQWVAASEENLRQKTEIHAVYTAVADRYTAVFEKMQHVDPIIGSQGVLSLKDNELCFSLYSADAIDDLCVDKIDAAIEIFVVNDRYDLTAVHNDAAQWERVLQKASFRIPVDAILFFVEKGSLQYTTSVSGGESYGGGVNIKGALWGGALFGTVGAVVGSTIGTEVHTDPLQTTIDTHDSRYISILYRCDNNDSVKEHQIPFDNWDALMTLIPSKEYSVVQATTNTQQNIPAPQVSATNIEQIKQLKELLDMGILTQEEFDLKKRQLLSL